MNGFMYHSRNSKMKLLWTNPNPLNSWSAQTVSLDLSSYQYVIIETYPDSVGDSVKLETKNSLIKVGDVGAFVGVLYAKPMYAKSCIDYGTAEVNKDGIIFSEVLEALYNSLIMRQGTSLIKPYKIYGINFDM